MKREKEEGGGRERVSQREAANRARDCEDVREQDGERERERERETSL